MNGQENLKYMRKHQMDELEKLIGLIRQARDSFHVDSSTSDLSSPFLAGLYNDMERALARLERRDSVCMGPTLEIVPSLYSMIKVEKEQLVASAPKIMNDYQVGYHNALEKFLAKADNRPPIFIDCCDKIWSDTDDPEKNADYIPYDEEALWQVIGSRLYTLRHVKEMSVDELATKSGVIPETISRIESCGPLNPEYDPKSSGFITLKTLAKICNALEVRMGVLVGDVGK